MLDCATAAFINRRSRIAEVIAAVPTAAHAARRIKSRRVMTETFLSFIKSLLNDVVGRADDQMNYSTRAVAHLGLVRGCAVGEIRRVRDITDDIRLRRR